MDNTSDIADITGMPDITDIADITDKADIADKTGITDVAGIFDITGLVFDIDHFAAHDGPGIRTCVYLKGCPLRCAWCHSPESQSPRTQLLYASARCVNCGFCAGQCPLGLHKFERAGLEGAPDADPDDVASAGGSGGAESFAHTFTDRERCTHCGRCADVCPSGALRMSGRMMTAGEVAREALEDIAFYKNSGGGVTLSGGEVLSQAEFTLALLKLIKAAGVHTIVETSGFGGESELLQLVPYVDIFYYDFKLFDAEMFSRYIGNGIDMIYSNLKKLRECSDGVVLRVPLIPGITDTADNLNAAIDLALELRINEIQLLPYNAATGAKYEWIGREYSLETGEWAPPDMDALIKRAGGSITISLVR